MRREIWKRPCINLFITYFARKDNMLLPFTRGQIICYCPREMLLPRRQITRRKLYFYYICKFGVISIKYVIICNIQVIFVGWNKNILTVIFIIDYYMAFLISHVISTRDAHISPRAERPRANMGQGLIWHVIWKMLYHNLLIIYFNASFFIFVRADRFQKPCSLIWDKMQ
jgi:hypothetical protein